MMEIILIVGSPTPAGRWSLSRSMEHEYRYGSPKVSDRIQVLPGNPVTGAIVDARWHDDGVVFTIKAHTLRLPSGLDDWRAALAPDVVAERLVEDVEAFLAHEVEGWSP